MNREQFGKANDFYRVKLFKIDQVEPRDFEWDELTAILGPREPLSPHHTFKVEIHIINIDSGITIKKIEFDKYKQAKLKFDAIHDDLFHMEKNEFDRKYLHI